MILNKYRHLVLNIFSYSAFDPHKHWLIFEVNNGYVFGTAQDIFIAKFSEYIKEQELNNFNDLMMEKNDTIEVIQNKDCSLEIKCLILNWINGKINPLQREIMADQIISIKE